MEWVTSGDKASFNLHTNIKLWVGIILQAGSPEQLCLIWPVVSICPEESHQRPEHWCESPHSRHGCNQDAFRMHLTSKARIWHSSFSNVTWAVFKQFLPLVKQQEETTPAGKMTHSVISGGLTVNYHCCRICQGRQQTFHRWNRKCNIFTLH